ACFNAGGLPMKKLVLSAIALTASAAVPALAADLPRKAPAYVPPPAPPAYVWTGCYIGGHICRALSHVSLHDNFTGSSVSNSNAGFAGGGQIGCDYQFAGGWVIGIRNLFNGTSISHTRNIDPLFFDSVFANPQVQTRTRWLDILTGRLG